MHVPLTRYAQTSDRPVEVQWSIIIIDRFRLTFTLNVDVIKRRFISRDTLNWQLRNVHCKFSAFLTPGATCKRTRYPLASFACHKVLFNVQ